MVVSAMLKLFRTYLGRYVPYVVLCLVLTLVQIFAELMLPDLMSDIVNTGIVGQDVSYIMRVGFSMLGWAALSMVAVICVSYCASRAAMSFGRDVRSAVFRKVESFSLFEFDEFGTSSLITRATNDVTQVERFLQMGISMALMSPFMFIGATIMAFHKSAQLSIIIFCTIPVLLVFIAILVKVGMPLLRSLQGRIDKLNLVTRENLTGMRVIRAYNKEPRVAERFAEANGELAETNVKVARLMGGLMPCIMFTINLAIVIIIWVGAGSIYAGDFLVGDLMAVIQYATMILMSVMMLSMMFAIMPRAMAAGERIGAVLAVDPAITDPAMPQAPVSAVRGSLQFEDVSYTFPGAEKPVISHLDATFEPGTTTAVIGSTGSGKSTFLNLLMRFYDPSSGSVLIDGQDVRQMTQADMRGRIAFVPQKAELFTGSVIDNIRVGDDDASFEQVEHAAHVAAADGFIRELEGGYDAQVSQGGKNLSGGQRQRLAIARAVVRDAEFFVFDDSFSALDFKTDKQVRAALAEATRDKTVIIVAQRVSVAMDADKVIVLDEGRVVGCGTHAELVESCSVYREIAASQLSEEELAASVAEGGR